MENIIGQGQKEKMEKQNREISKHNARVDGNQTWEERLKKEWMKTQTAIMQEQTPAKTQEQATDEVVEPEDARMLSSEHDEFLSIAGGRHVHVHREDFL